MGDGLKYVFEIDPSDDGLSKTIDKLERAEHAESKLGVTSEKLERSHGAHAKSAEHLGGVLDRLVHASMEPFLHKAKEIAEFEFIRRGVDALIEAPEEIIDKLKELGEEMIEVAAKTERTNKSFELLFGAAEGSEVLEYIEGIAKYTEFTGENLKGAAQSLAKVGFEGEGLQRALAASIDIAAFSPNKEQGFGEALSALERIKRTGRVDNRVLGGLGVGQDAFLQELSARTGKSTAVLKKAMAEGKVAAQDALESLYSMISKKTGKDLGGAGVEMSKTLSAQLTHLKELPELFFEKLAKSPALEGLKAELSGLLELLDPESPNGQRIFSALEDAFSMVVDVVGKIDFKSIAETIEDDIVPATRTMVDVVKDVGKALEPIAAGFKFVAGVVDKLNAISGNDIKSAGTSREARLYDAPGMRLNDELHARLRQQRSLKAMGIDPILGPIEASGFDRLAARRAELAGETIGSKLVEGVRGPKGIDAHSPSKKFEHLGEMAADGFRIGAQGAADDIVSGAFAVPASAGGRNAQSTPIMVSFGDIHVGAAAAGSDPREHAQALMAMIRQMAPDVLADALEQARLRAGA